MTVPHTVLHSVPHVLHGVSVCPSPTPMGRAMRAAPPRGVGASVGVEEELSCAARYATRRLCISEAMGGEWCVGVCRDPRDCTATLLPRVRSC